LKRHAALRHNKDMRFIKQISIKMREIIFPADCALCGRTLLTSKEAACGLCEECSKKFPVEGGERCSRCGKPLISETGICINCKKNPEWDFDSAAVIYPYLGRYRELLMAYKFEKHKPLACFLAEKLLQAERLLCNEAKDAVWVPVPPRAGKLKHSFWDQVEVIAQRLEEAGTKVKRCLKRLPSRAQKELGLLERRKNLQGKIIVTKAPPKRIILFDDVFTTGSTLSVCANALKAAGAEKIFGICLFYD
jgi:ComF family protein